MPQRAYLKETESHYEYGIIVEDPWILILLGLLLLSVVAFLYYRKRKR